MRHKTISILMALSLCLLLATPVRAQGAEELEDTLTGHLSSKEDVRWYRFQLSEPGDVTLTVYGLQEAWDGWNSHWTVTIYGPDRETVLAQADAKGYNAEYSPPAELKLYDLDSGEYHIQITNASNNHFTTDSYRLELEIAYRSGQGFASSDGEVCTMGDDPILDRLTDPGQVRWYQFELAEPGDAILTAAGQQGSRDSYSYHWRCDVYGPDRETVLAQGEVQGYHENNSPTVLALPGLEAGTYYAAVSCQGAGNPLTQRFTTDPYQLRLLRHYRSDAPVYRGEGMQTFQTQGDVLWDNGEAGFLKLNDGECFGALMKARSGAVVPILVSTQAEAVEYLVTSTGETVSAAGPWRHVDSGVEYYYSDCERVSLKKSGASSLPILFVDTFNPRTAAEKIADKLLEAEMGAREYWWMKNRDTFYLVGAISCFLVVAIVLQKVRRTWDDSGGGSSGGGSESDSSGSLWEAIVEDRIDGI